MSHVEDAQIKDGQYKPGTLLEDGKWRCRDRLNRSGCAFVVVDALSDDKLGQASSKCRKDLLRMG